MIVPVECPVSVGNMRVFNTVSCDGACHGKAICESL